MSGDKRVSRTQQKSLKSNLSHIGHSANKSKDLLDEFIPWCRVCLLPLLSVHCILLSAALPTLALNSRCSVTGDCVLYSRRMWQIFKKKTTIEALSRVGYDKPQCVLTHRGLYHTYFRKLSTTNFVIGGKDLATAYTLPQHFHTTTCKTRLFPLEANPYHESNESASQPHTFSLA